MSGAYHIELMTRPGSLTVYVTDHGFQPIETAGATSEAMVVTNGKKTMLKLQAAGKNVLEGRGKFTLIEESIVHLKVIMYGSEAELATCKPLRERDGKPADSEQQDHL